MKRIYSIDLFKLAFAYLIALGHFGINRMPGAETTVQLFFILSGFFLAKKYYTKTASVGEETYSQWNYTLDHVKSLYPHYLFSLLIMVAFQLIQPLVALVTQFDLTQIGIIRRFLYERIPELLFLQKTGFFVDGINYPLWQVSVLLIGGYFIYGALCINEKRARQFVFPLVILMVQTLLKSGVGIWDIAGGFYVPILRAVSPMCIGVLTYHVTTTKYYDLLKQKSIAYNVVAILCVVLIPLSGGDHNIFLITFPVALLALYDENSWINRVLNRKLFSWFGDFSYAIYLNHALVIDIFNNYLLPWIKGLVGADVPMKLQGIVFLVLLSVYSVITTLLINKYKSRRRAMKGTT